MDTPLNLIHVQETVETTLQATGVKLIVSIKGQSFFTGSEAFHKAIEVTNCVAELKQCGLRDDQIQLLNVATEVESGILTKSSKASYELLVNCAPIELLGAVLTVISAQKNTKITDIVWEYSAMAQMKQELLQQAVNIAKAVAQSIADSLGVGLLGVHKLAYQISGIDAGLVTETYDSSFYRSRKSAGLEALKNFNLAHTSPLAVSVTAEFIVDTFRY